MFWRLGSTANRPPPLFGDSVFGGIAVVIATGFWIGIDYTVDPCPGHHPHHDDHCGCGCPPNEIQMFLFGSGLDSFSFVVPADTPTDPLLVSPGGLVVQAQGGGTLMFLWLFCCHCPGYY